MQRASGERFQQGVSGLKIGIIDILKSSHAPSTGAVHDGIDGLQGVLNPRDPPGPVDDRGFNAGGGKGGVGCSHDGNRHPAGSKHRPAKSLPQKSIGARDANSHGSELRIAIGQHGSEGMEAVDRAAALRVDRCECVPDWFSRRAARWRRSVPCDGSLTWPSEKKTRVGGLRSCVAGLHGWPAWHLEIGRHARSAGRFEVALSPG